MHTPTGFVDEVRSYPGWHQDPSTGLWTTTGPMTVTRPNDPGSFSESLNYACTQESGIGVPAATDAISNIQSHPRTDGF